MQVSREYTLKELVAIRDLLNEWIGEMETPARLVNGGKPEPLFPDGVPPGTPVEDLGLPVLQFRAEMSGAAARLEALVMAG